MQNVKLYVSGLILAGMAAMPLAAQQPSQNPSPSTPSTPQSTPAQTSPQVQPGIPGATPGQQTTPSQPSSASQPGTPAQAGDQNPVPSTANSPEASNSELRPIQGELEKKLDAKSAKAGDAVVVKTTEKATIGDGVVIPKGSKIVGQVVDAEPAAGGNKNSKVTVLFNQAQLKDGQTLPIKSVLQSLAPATGADNNSAAYGSSGAMASAPTTSGGAMAGSPAGGAPMGGSAAAPVPSSPSATAGPAPTMSAGNNASEGNAQVATGKVVARQGNVAIMTTQIPGVLIASSVNGQPFSNASGAILGAQQNLHLDSGTHVVLAIADAGTKAGNTK